MEATTTTSTATMNNKVQNNTTMKKINLKSWLTDILVMAKRDLLKIKHSPEKLFDVTLMPIIMTIVFSQLFGGAIMKGNPKAYLALVVPGILIQTLVMASGAAGTQLREDMDKGATDRFNSLPIVRVAPLAGTLLSDIIRYIIASIFTLGTGLALGWRADAGFGWILVAIGLAVITTWALSWIFALVGVIANSAATVTTIVSFLTMFLAFLSNAYVPVSTMPKWLQVIANNNPVSHLITAFKQVAYNGSFGKEAWLVLLISVIIVLVLAPITVLVYSKKD